MDRDSTYRAIVKRVLQEVADITPSDERRVDEVFIHIDVCEGKVWLQHDGTNLRIAEDLTRAGIPKADIVLAFHHPSRRADTEYAVA
jgi:hypothetical protein